MLGFESRLRLAQSQGPKCERLQHHPRARMRDARRCARGHLQTRRAQEQTAPTVLAAPPAAYEAAASAGAAKAAASVPKVWLPPARHASDGVLLRLRCFKTTAISCIDVKAGSITVCVHSSSPDSMTPAPVSFWFRRTRTPPIHATFQHLRSVCSQHCVEYHPAVQIFVLGILAGVYIGFGAFLMLSVGGSCPGLASTNPGLKAMVSGLMGLPTGALHWLRAAHDLPCIVCVVACRVANQTQRSPTRLAALAAA